MRVTDIEVVGAQATKSRRWFADENLWAEMAKRLAKTSSPPIEVLHGDAELLSELLGPPTDARAWTLVGARPTVRGEIVIAQPGLSWSALADRIKGEDLAAIQIRDLLTVFDDAISSLAETVVVSSK